MKKKTIILISILISFMVILIVSGFVLVYTMFAEQYNSKGVSSLLIISIDTSKPKEYIGKLEGYDIYIENLNKDELYFISIKDEHISLETAINEELVSVSDWRKKAWNIKKDSNIEILQYENYEIAINDKECVIRPLTK